MISPLNRATYHNITRETYGGKAYNLRQIFPMLSALNRMVSPSRVSIPKTYVVGIDMFDSFTQDNQVVKSIKAIKDAHEINPKEADKVNSLVVFDKFYRYGVDQAISSFIEGIAFSEDQSRELWNVFDHMRSKKIPLIVRSSSFREDDEKTQCAGIYSSEFVEHSSDEQKYFENFMLAIKRVYASVYQTKAEEYMRRENIDDYDRMGIVVQQVVGYDREVIEHAYPGYPGYSGTCYGPDFSGVTLLDPYRPIIRTSASPGLNTTVVDGKPVFDFDFSRDSSKMSSEIRAVPRILYQLVKRNANDRNLFRINIDPNKPTEKQSSTALRNYSGLKKDSERLRDVASDVNDVFLNICNKLGPSEIEWSVIEKDDAGLRRLYLLQRKPSFVNSTPLVRLEIPRMAPERIIAEGTEIFGHGEAKGYMLLDERLRNPALQMHSNDFTLAVTFFPFPYIFVTDTERFDTLSSAIFLPNLAGVIDLSGKINLSQHEAKKFMNGNSKILAVNDVDWGIINIICSGKSGKRAPISYDSDGSYNEYERNSIATLYQSGFLSSQEVHLYVDMLSVFGQAYLPNPKSK